MKKTCLILALPIMLALTLTGCGDKNNESPVAPAPSSQAVTAAPVASPVPPSPAPVAASTGEAPAGTDDSAALQSSVKSYQAQVDASNKKAEDVMKAYTNQIESVTGK